MSILELGFYFSLFIATTLISIEWAKHGILELGLQGPRNRKVFAGIFIGLAASILGGIAYNKSLFVPNLKIIVALNLWPLLLIRFRRKLMPAGQFLFNMARERILYWARMNYSPGEILEAGDNLSAFPRAIKTVDLLSKAILELKPLETEQSRLNAAIAYGELGFLHRMMNRWDDAHDSFEHGIALLKSIGERSSMSEAVKSALSLIVFRLAETDHVTGRVDEAVAGYRKSIALDRELGDAKGVKVTEAMLARISQKGHRRPNE